MQKDKLKELTIDEWIWVIFIILSIMNIIGDELEKHFCIEHDLKDKDISKKIFTFTVSISFLIYIYLSYQKYEVMKSRKEHHLDTQICETRFFASLLVVIAAFLYLYCQLTDSADVNPSIV